MPNLRLWFSLATLDGVCLQHLAQRRCRNRRFRWNMLFWAVADAVQGWRRGIDRCDFGLVTWSWMAAVHSWLGREGALMMDLYDSSSHELVLPAQVVVAMTLTNHHFDAVSIADDGNRAHPLSKFRHCLFLEEPVADSAISLVSWMAFLPSSVSIGRDLP
jgi:hypothetical protein